MRKLKNVCILKMKTRFEEINEKNILIKSKRKQVLIGKLRYKSSGKYNSWQVSLEKNKFIGAETIDDIRNKIKELNKNTMIQKKNINDDEKWRHDAMGDLSLGETFDVTDPMRRYNK